MFLGLLMLLAIFGHFFTLRDPNTPRIINPSELVPPKVEVRR